MAQSGDYRRGFLTLLVPAIAALITLSVAWRLFPRPQDLEVETLQLTSSGAFSRTYWVYLAGSALVAAGYADYPLLAYHFAHTSSIALPWIPAAYALAMGVDALAALAFGRFFDRFGLGVLIIATAASAAFAPLAFGSRTDLAIAGTILWGIGMGAQESIMRAAIANMTPPARRATAYGVFNLVYGVAWFGGSALMGWMYGRSLGWLIAFSVTAQVLALPFFAWSKRLSRGRS